MPRFNYTGRKKINRQDVTITVFDNNGILKFKADMNLKEYGLPAESPVYVEAYRQTSWMRFESGVVCEPDTPKDSKLSEFDSLEGIRFRIKVTQREGAHGKLLAMADKIHPLKPEEGDTERTCILPVQSADMECIWKIQFDEEPILLVSKKAGSKDMISKSPEFITLVYPAILREVLYEIKTSDDDWQEEEEAWQKQWIEFINLLPGVGKMPELPCENEDAYDQWVEDAVDSFSRKLKIVETFVSCREDGE